MQLSMLHPKWTLIKAFVPLVLASPVGMLSKKAKPAADKQLNLVVRISHIVTKIRAS